MGKYMCRTGDVQSFLIICSSFLFFKWLASDLLWIQRKDALLSWQAQHFKYSLLGKEEGNRQSCFFLNGPPLLEPVFQQLKACYPHLAGAAYPSCSAALEQAAQQVIPLESLSSFLSQVAPGEVCIGLTELSGMSVLYSFSWSEPCYTPGLHGARRNSIGVMPSMRWVHYLINTTSLYGWTKILPAAPCETQPLKWSGHANIIWAHQ